MLFLDLDVALIYQLADWLADAIGDKSTVLPVAGGAPEEREKPPVISITGGAAEENLWDRITVEPRRPDQPEDFGFRWAPGPLVGDDEITRIVVLPDLAWAGLPVSRAAVTLVGADVAHLERSGVSQRWHPQDRWLAALRSHDTGRVSAHLLDRFSVRVDAEWLRLPRHGGKVLPDPPSDWKDRIQAVRRRNVELPAMSDAATDRVVETLPARYPGIRRDLALARLARGMAALYGDAEVTPRHVDEAASLVGMAARPPAGSNGHSNGHSRRSSTGRSHLGLHASSADSANGAQPTSPGQASSFQAGTSSFQAGTGREPPTVPSPTLPSGTVPLRPALPPAAPGARGNGWTPHGPHGKDDIKARVAAIGGDKARLTPEKGAPVLGGHNGAAAPSRLYPEDTAQPGRDLAPLRLGWQRAVAGPPRGTPIGTQRAVDTRDIAMASTLLYAARFQRRRCQEHRQLLVSDPNHHLHVRVADLRSYRRAPRPAALLVLVLDHTSRVRGWDWYGVLAPYLRWAYVNRALVGVVQVGAGAEGPPELRATQFRSRGVLDPRVAQALRSGQEGRATARATPLAHALSLAMDMLRHDTQQAGAPVSKAYLVVITDGRANVPLDDSLLARTPRPPVGHRAVTDAGNVAGKIGALRRVRGVVVDSGPRANAYLTEALAKALGGRLVHADPPADGSAAGWPGTEPGSGGA